MLLDGKTPDLPKGRLEPGEGELQCALRELEEETGVRPQQIRLWESVCLRVLPSEHGRRTWVVFVAEALEPLVIVPHDHDDFAWIPWDPPHRMDREPRIEAALKQLSAHLKSRDSTAPRATAQISPMMTARRARASKKA